MENALHYIPIVPMRGMIIFPHMNLNFDAGREISVKGLSAATEENSLVFLTAQKDIEKENPKLEDLYNIGTIAQIKQIMHLPGNVTRVVVTGIKRGVIREFTASKPYFKAVIEEFDEFSDGNAVLKEAYLRRLKKSYEEYFAQNPRMNADDFVSVMAVDDIGKLCDTIAGGSDLKIEQKQKLLEEFDVFRRAEMLMADLSGLIEILRVEQKIARKVKENIDKNQREYYLREQLKVISDELGDKDGINAEVKEYTAKIKKANLHPVGNCVSGCCLTFHGTRQVDRSAVQQEFLCQSSLSGIRVRDNCKCSSSVDFFFQIAQRISPRLSIRKHPDRLPDASCLHNPNQPPPFFHAGSRISAQLESVYHIFFCLARISFGDSKQP